jgi:hypothetical protein
LPVDPRQGLWDQEAEVGSATSEDVPGRVTEAPTPQELLVKLRIMIPERLALGDGEDLPFEVPLYVMHERVTKVRLRA